MMLVRPRAYAVVIAAGLALVCGAAQATPEGDRARAARLYASGQQELVAGNLPAALRLLDEAAEIAPDVPQVRYALGLALFATGDEGRALEELREVVRLDPRHARAWNGIGNVHHRRREPRRALEAYLRAMELDPRFLVAARNAGWIAEQLEQLDVAEAAYRRCLATEPRAPQEVESWKDARFRLGALRYRARDLEAAVALMRDVVRDDSNHPRAHYYLGQALLRTGHVDEGRRHLARHDELTRAQKRGGSAASAEQR